MRKIRDVLRLTAAGMSSRNIALSLSIGATTVIDFLQRARSASMSWPLPEDMTDEALEIRLFPASTALAEIKARRPQPDWRTIHRELRRKGVTLQLLWEEHRAAQLHRLRHSRFCDLYRAWEARLSPTMRQTHVAGERLFVDYAGTTLEVINGLTGEVMTAQLFVAALGASSYTYAEATWTQGLADWIGSHTRAFAFVGGVTAMVVSDNLKSGITKACFYEPAVNRSYAEMAAHYDTAIVPARPGKPRDKAKVEVAVLLATRWIVAKLRNRQFFSLTDLNDAIRDCVTALNAWCADAASGNEPARAVRRDRASGAQTAAGRALHVRAVEGMPGWTRLSRGGREALLLGAASVATREAVGAHHHAHGRAVPSRQSRRRAPAVVLGPQAHDGARAHAVEPPALR